MKILQVCILKLAVQFLYTEIPPMCMEPRGFSLILLLRTCVCDSCLELATVEREQCGKRVLFIGVLRNESARSGLFVCSDIDRGHDDLRNVRYMHAFIM
jgi:hypothetical protein